MSDKRVVDNFKSLPQQVNENTEDIVKIYEIINEQNSKISSLESYIEELKQILRI